MRCSGHNKLPSHSFLGAKFFKLSLSSRSAPTSSEPLSLIVSVGRIIYTQLQVYSSRVHAGKDYSIMLGGCVSAYLHFVRSKVVTCCVMKLGRERLQASSGQVSHELYFSSGFNFSAAHPSELYRLG